MRAVTAAEMRALDEHTIRVLGVPGVVLMESAGRAVADLVGSLVAGVATNAAKGEARVVVVAGAGNNGGDGFVVARHLANRGIAVRVLLCADASKIAGDARTHYAAMLASAVPVAEVTATAESISAATQQINGAAVIVDALLGTGTARPVTGLMAEVIALVNRAPGMRVAVDVPSGLDVDRGHPLGACVRADHTVTFALPKIGLVTSPGHTYVGRLHVADIGVPRRLAASSRCELLDEECLHEVRAPRPALAHKGSFGHVLIVAGSSRHPGAALLCAEAAARAGAGLVTVAAVDSVCAALAGRAREVSLAPLGPDLDDARAASASSAIVPSQPAAVEAAWTLLSSAMAGKKALAIGPGLSPSTAMRALLTRIYSTWEGPLVVDADGLNLLALDASPLASTRAQVILTPHPTEMARLAGVSTVEIQSDRVAAARAYATAHRVLVVLKGDRTVVAAPDGMTYICPTGNPGMASGGTGDVLTGVIGALVARGLAPVAAATAGVYLHGLAGDLGRARIGEAGLLASDLIALLPQAMRPRELAAPATSPID